MFVTFICIYDLFLVTHKRYECVFLIYFIHFFTWTVWMFCLYVCMFTMCMFGTYRRQKQTLDVLQQDVGMILHDHVSAGSKLQGFYKSNKWSKLLSHLSSPNLDIYIHWKPIVKRIGLFKNLSLGDERLMINVICPNPLWLVQPWAGRPKLYKNSNLSSHDSRRTVSSISPVWQHICNA